MAVVGKYRLIALSLLLLALLSLPARAATAGDAKLAPYWLRSDETVNLYKTLDSGSALIGRSFVLVPQVPKDRAPRYDYRVLLTFGREALEEHRVFGHGSYALAYGDREFSFPGLILGTISGAAAALFSKLGYRPPTFALADDGEDHLYFIQNASGQGMDTFPISIGFLRELKPEEATRFKAHLLAEEQAEKAKRTADLHAAKGGPLAVIDAYNYGGSELIWKIYYGLFDQLDDPRLQGDRPDLVASRKLARDAVLSQMFQAYHKTYSLRYAAQIQEPTFPDRTDLVERDGWGHEISRVEGQTYHIRKRFQESYERSRPNLGRNLGALFSASQNGVLSPAKMWDPSTACSRFLADSKALSPGTVAHFEENLERALLGREPKALPLPRYAVTPPYRLPWEPAVTALPRETLDKYAVSWIRPSDWQKLKRGFGGVVVFNPGFTPALRVVVTYEPQVEHELLTQINFWRKGEENLEPVQSLSEQPMERFEVSGRSVVLIAFPKTTRALLQDGPRSWFVLMDGAKEGVTARRDEMRAFVKSFQWQGVPQLAEQPVESQRPTVQERSLRRAAPGRRPSPPDGELERARNEPEPALKEAASEPGRSAPTSAPAVETPAVEATEPEPTREKRRETPAGDVIPVARHLRFNVEPTDAFILIRGAEDERFTLIGQAKEYEKAAFDMPGEGIYDVWVRADGWQDQRLRVQVTAGGRAEVAIQLSP